MWPPTTKILLLSKQIFRIALMTKSLITWNMNLNQMENIYLICPSIRNADISLRVNFHNRKSLKFANIQKVCTRISPLLLLITFSQKNWAKEGSNIHIKRARLNRTWVLLTWSNRDLSMKSNYSLAITLTCLWLGIKTKIIYFI